MADIALTAATVTWSIANQIQNRNARGANGYVEFEASAVAFFHGGLTVLPSPQRAEVVNGTMTPIDLPVNDPEVWNWKVTPHVGVHWTPFHTNIPAGGVDLSSAAITPGTGPVRVLQGPQGGSVVGAEDQGDGTIRFVLDDGTRTDPMPITRGPAGPANQISIGTVLRGDAPYAGLSGSAPNQVLNLVLPKGDPGNPEDLIDATPTQRGLMSAPDKAHLDLTPTRAEVVESTNSILWETYSLADNFHALDPRYVTRLDVRGNNVMQAFGRDQAGQWYVTQILGTNGDITVTRCDAGGREVGSSTLIGGGHGNPWGFEEVDGDVYMWIFWDQDIRGQHNLLRRWRYVDGATVGIADPSVETLPDFVTHVPGFDYLDISINQRLDLIGFHVRVITNGVLTDKVHLRRLSEYKAGIDNVIATLPDIDVAARGAFQGFTVTEDHVYISRGLSGVWPQSPHIDMYQWSDGALIHTKDTSYLAYGGVNPAGKAEAEGMVPIWDSAGRMGLLFGQETGATGANIHSVYSIAPTDFQSDTGVGQSMNRLYAPLHWVDVPLNAGYEHRGAGYELQVARDAHGMVHLRGQMGPAGMADLSALITFARLPRQFIPEREVRWIGFATGRFDRMFGGWISATTGDIVLQYDTGGNTAGPSGHWSLIAQPWQSRS